MCWLTKWGGPLAATESILSIAKSVRVIWLRSTYELKFKTERPSRVIVPAAKPPRSMDHKITVGGERGGWVLICLLGKFCEMRGRIGVTLPPWKILRIVFKCEVKSAMLPFVAHIYCPCRRRRSIGPLPSCSSQNSSQNVLN